jgi:hypothetical protein
MLLLACCPTATFGQNETREVEASTIFPPIGPVDPTSSTSCDGPISPALFRFQWAYQVPPGSDLNELDNLVKQWMAGCREVVRYGQGPAVTTDPAELG